MDEQQFRLRWNNYQVTLHHVFYKLWQSGTFADVSLIVEGKKIDCHKLVLSACSTYFEKLLSEHSSHPHPLILLHDMPYSDVLSLITFMYNGEINVSREQLSAVLKIADILKVKGLTECKDIENFTNLRFMPYYSDSSRLEESLLYAHSTSKPVNSNQRSVSPYSRGLETQNFNSVNNSLKRSEPNNNGNVHSNKRARRDSPLSLPPSPPISLGDTQNHEPVRTSPHQDKLDEVKVEVEEETDTELQIDESVEQSPEESAESDGLASSRNTPVADFETQERESAARSLAALAQGAFSNIVNPQPHLLLAPKVNSNGKIKEEKTTGHGGKNGEKAYTIQDLEEGIESVLTGSLTPAKAIAKYKIPRRTFFRRLSAVRKMRGIPSSKENASENYLNARVNQNASALQANRNLPTVIPGLVSAESAFIQAKGGIKLSKDPLDDRKKEANAQNLSLPTPNGVFNKYIPFSSGYDYYMKCLKLHIDPNDIKKESVDDNSNISSEPTEQALALVTHNVS